MVNFGVKQAQQGQSILAADPTQLAFSSKYGAFLFSEIKTQSITLASGATSGSVTFDFDFNLPIVWSFIRYSQDGTSQYGYPLYANRYYGMYQWANILVISGGFVSISEDTTNTNKNQTTINFTKTGGAAVTIDILLAVFVDQVLGEPRILPAQGSFGVKVAETGNNVFSPDLNDFAYHSGYGTLSIVDSATVTLEKGVELAIPHNLAYVPLVSAVGFPYFGFNFGPENLISADRTNLYLYYNNSLDPDVSKEVTYHTFTERLAAQ